MPPRGCGGRCPYVWPVSRRTGPAAVRTLHPVTQASHPLPSRRSVARPPTPESELGVPVPQPRGSSTPHRSPDDGAEPRLGLPGCPDPVAGIPPIALAGEPTSVTGVGAPVCRRTDPVGPRRRPSAPVARAVELAPPDWPRSGAVGVLRSSSSRIAAPLRVPGKPVARCDEAGGFSLRPEPLSPRGRGPSPTPIRPEDRSGTEPVPRPGLRCALRYVAYSREGKTPGQEVFLNPQGYPLNFFEVPRNSVVVHRAFTRVYTALSPARTRRPTPAGV